MTGPCRWPGLAQWVIGHTFGENSCCKGGNPVWQRTLRLALDGNLILVVVAAAFVAAMMGATSAHTVGRVLVGEMTSDTAASVAVAGLRLLKTLRNRLLIGVPLPSTAGKGTCTDERPVTVHASGQLRQDSGKAVLRINALGSQYRLDTSREKSYLMTSKAAL